MRIALVNPNWSFDGSIYFGCRAPHLPLEFGYARQMLEATGHVVKLVDGQLMNLSHGEIGDAVRDFVPDMTVVTTAPSYLFWRCAPPELRVPQETIADLRAPGGCLVAIGPHASTTPRATLRKLGADAAILGEAEEVLVRLAAAPRDRWSDISSLCYADGGGAVVQGGPHIGDMTRLPALRWENELVRRHAHHHHRFDASPPRAGAEIETSRGCPYRCTFCAKEKFRDTYRRRPLGVVLDELDRLIGQGVDYVYFIDEIFLPNRALLAALVERNVRFGVQTRIDLWSEAMLEQLGAAGCVSIEAGVESLTEEGRDRLDKNCRLTTEDLTARLVFAKQHVPFVQANLIATGDDDPTTVAAWRDALREKGVWANDPVPLFPYPGSPDYRLLWGEPDDHAWERAHAHYLERCVDYSDIQEQRPLPLEILERRAVAGAA